MILSDGLHSLEAARGEHATDEESPRRLGGCNGPRHALWCRHTFGGIAASEHCRIHIVNNL